MSHAADADNLMERFKSFLLRLAPGSDAQWWQADEEQVEKLQTHAQAPLPPFYRWFLQTMGEGAGPMPFDHAFARTVLNAYEDGAVPVRPNQIFICPLGDDMWPGWMYYDLDRPARGDFLLIQTRRKKAFTFAEYLATLAFLNLRVFSAPCYVYGSFQGKRPHIRHQLIPLLTAQGFTVAFETGPSVYLLERVDGSCMKISLGQDEEVDLFDLAGTGERVLKSMLELIAAETALEVKEGKWRNS